MAASRTRHAPTVLSLVVILTVVAAVGVVLSAGGQSDVRVSPASETQTALTLNGVSQSHTTLGDPLAPVTLTVFADLRSPVTRAFMLLTLPALIDRYVRAGQVRVQLRLPAPPGDSARAARFALGAARQNRLWSFADLFVRNQQPATTNYVSGGFLRRLSAGIPGLRYDAALRAPGTSAALDRDRAAWRQTRTSGLPAFLVGPSGGPMETVPLTSLDPDVFAAAISAAQTSR